MKHHYTYELNDGVGPLLFHDQGKDKEEMDRTINTLESYYHGCVVIIQETRDSSECNHCNHICNVIDSFMSNVDSVFKEDIQTVPAGTSPGANARTVAGAR